MRYLLPTLWTVAASSLFAVGGAACGAFEAFDAGSLQPGAGTGATNSTGGSFGGDMNTGGMAGGDQTYNFSAFCGDMCIPGTNELADCSPPNGQGGDGGAGGNMGGAGGSMGGAGGSMGGAGGSMGGAGGSMGGAGGAIDRFVDDCRLEFSNNELNGTCITINTSEALFEGDPCLFTSQCGPGLACVDIDSTSQCRAYCCGDVEACPSGESNDTTYCALAPLSPMDAPPDTEVPVCLPADSCELGKPCADTEKVCTIVRLDGQTSCVPPGDGEADGECPCQEGLFCDTTQNKCLKFCELGKQDACPEEGFSCQGGSSAVPEGFGTCVETI